MAKFFVFIEFKDAEVNGLITGIREVVGTKAGQSNIHLTIRGPYSVPVSAARLKSYQRLLEPHPVLLDGFGLFHSSNKTVVYMKAQHPMLRRIWWKPDFPIRKYGFNPHITLYEGDDRGRAEHLKAFLEKEGLKLLVSKFQVTGYVSDHTDLFPSNQSPDEPFLNLSLVGLVRPDILNRLKRAIRNVE